MNNQHQHQVLAIDQIPAKLSQTLRRWKAVEKMTANTQRISQIALKVTPETMINRVKQQVRDAVIHKVQNKQWAKYQDQSNPRAQPQLRRSQARCRHWIGLSIFKATSSSIGRASTVNLPDDQEQVISLTEKEHSLSATVPSRRKRGKDNSAKSCANSRISKMNAKE